MLKTLFEKNASVVTIYITLSLSACCVKSGNSISALYSWTQNSEGLPSNHEHFYYVNYKN